MTNSEREPDHPRSLPIIPTRADILYRLTYDHAAGLHTTVQSLEELTAPNGEDNFLTWLLKESHAQKRMVFELERVRPRPGLQLRIQHILSNPDLGLTEGQAAAAAKAVAEAFGNPT